MIEADKHREQIKQLIDVYKEQVSKTFDTAFGLTRNTVKIRLLEDQIRNYGLELMFDAIEVTMDTVNQMIRNVNDKGEVR